MNGTAGAERLWLHCIGAHDGTTGFDATLSSAAGTWVAVVLYEPDTDAGKEQREHASLRRSQTVTLPYALAERTGPVPLRDALPNARREVPAYRLDEVPELLAGDIERPDVLDVTAPGMAYEVLAGAGALLAGAAAVIVTLPYVVQCDGERSFGDAMALLETSGFRVAGALADIDAQPYRAPLGFRGKSARIASRMLFVRDLDQVMFDPVASCKLAFVAHLLGQTTYGFTCMARFVERHGPVFGPTGYGRFLASLQVARARMPDLQPASFTELYSVEESYARFDPAQRHAVEARLFAKGREIVAAALAKRDVVALLGPGDTPVEAVFRTYGLGVVADMLSARRRADLTRYFAALGCTVQIGPA